MWGIGEKRIVARTADEVDRAFSGKAKEIVIEGNDTLIRYAELKAGLPSGPSEEPPAPGSTGGFGEDPNLSVRQDRSSIVERHLPDHPDASPMHAPPLPSAAPPLTVPEPAAASRPRFLLIASVLLVAIILGSVLYLAAVPPKTESVTEQTTEAPAAIPTPEPQTAGQPGNDQAPIATDPPADTPPVGAPSPHAAAPYPAPAALPDVQSPAPEENADGPARWMPFVWPLVALVAIVLMFLLARQAIAGGSNVSFEWRITEKVQGKLKVTRVRPPPQR